MVYNTTLFDIPTLADYLHGLGLQLGLYNQPGIPCEATNKTIYGTDITVGSAFSGVEDVNGYCYFDYDNTNTQLYHNTLIDIWASWGVDMIKLDYITPGSSTGNQTYPSNTSASAIAYPRPSLIMAEQSDLTSPQMFVATSHILGFGRLTQRVFGYLSISIAMGHPCLLECGGSCKTSSSTASTSTIKLLQGNV